MKPFLAAVILCPWLAISAWCQPTTLPPQQALPQVRQFLGLTDSQVTAILQDNNDYNAFSVQQQRQIQNAQSQIAVETAKDSLDPMAIGTLYAGIESACRDLRDKAATSQKQNLSILTDAQKSKLNILNDAMKLAPIISEAQSGNLLGSTNLTPFALSDFLLGGVTILTGFPPVPGCGNNGVPTGAFRSGDFSSFTPGNIIPATGIAPVSTGTSQPGAAGNNEAAATASPLSQWFSNTHVESNPAPRQSREELHKQYGSSVSETLLARPGVFLTVSYAETGEVCEMIIHPQPLTSSLNYPITKTMASKALNEMIDDLAPMSQRGKLLMGQFLNITCLPLDNCFGTSESYERVTIRRIGGTDKHRYATIQWQAAACRK